MVCAKCTTSRDYPDWGAEAWKGGVNCEGVGAGQTHCDFIADIRPQHQPGPRWRCCCATIAGFVTRPVCFDNDDLAGGEAEGGVKPYHESPFERSDLAQHDCAQVNCRDQSSFDRHYRNSGVNSLLKGKVWGKTATDEYFEVSDECKDSKTLREAHCLNYPEEGKPYSVKEIPCEGSCEDGACVEH